MSEVSVNDDAYGADNLTRMEYCKFYLTNVRVDFNSRNYTNMYPNSLFPNL